MNRDKRPIRLFNIYDRKRGGTFSGNVYSSKGIAPTLNTMGGGRREPMILESYEYKTCKITKEE